MEDKEILDSIHTNIHGLRMLSNYKPSEFEKRLSRIISEKYSPTCKECRERNEKLKSPSEAEAKGFLGKLGAWAHSVGSIE
jgi:hypothetical protein